MFEFFSLLSPRGELLSLAVIGMNNAALEIDATVVATANARRITLAEGSGGLLSSMVRVSEPGIGQSYRAHFDVELYSA